MEREEHAAAAKRLWIEVGEPVAAAALRAAQDDEEIGRDAPDAANRSVYESFLNRAKDLQERLYLDTLDARVVTVALPPLARKGLSRLIIALIGLAGGLLIGLMLALIRGEPSPNRRISSFAE